MIFSTLYTTLPHNLIADKLIDLIERTINRRGYPYLACSDRNAFLLWKKTKKISCMILSKCMWCSDLFVGQHFLFVLAPNCINKKLGLHLSISNDIISTRIHDKREDFDFEIVNFPFLDSDVPCFTSYPFARASILFNTRNKLLTQKLLTQGYQHHKLCKTFF